MSDDTAPPPPTGTDDLSQTSAALRKLHAATLLQAEAVVDLHVAIGLGALELEPAPAPEPEPSPEPTPDPDPVPAPDPAPSPPPPPDPPTPQPSPPPPPPPVPDPAPSPPPPQPKPGKVATVHGKPVELMTVGIHTTCKGETVQVALQGIDQLTQAMWQPGLKPKLVGLFMGHDNPRNIEPGGAIAEGLPDTLAKRGQICVWSLPMLFDAEAVSPAQDSRYPHTNQAKFRDVLSGKYDGRLRVFAKWIDGTNGWVRFGWEKGSHFFPHSVSSRDGYHYDLAEAVRAYNHVMDVIASEAHDVRFSDDEFRRAFQGNGKDPATGKNRGYTYIDPSSCAFDPGRCHQCGVDIYPGDFRNGNPGQSWDDWFTRDNKAAGGTYPSSLEGWAKHAKNRGQVLSVGEFGPLGRTDVDFIKGMYDRLKKLSASQPIGYLMYFHQDSSRIVNVRDQEANVATFKATFGSME